MWVWDTHFEENFEDKNSRSREYAFLAKSYGLNQVICVINKIDVRRTEDSINASNEVIQYSEQRFIEIKEKVEAYLMKLGFASNKI